jgi:CheY-like chemotaxis protein
MAVENGKEVLDIVSKRRPDLIISDILMLVMDGFMLCKHLKSDASSRHMPFVAEDDNVIRVLAGDILRSWGYKVILCEDGETAITMFRSRMESSDLVILDLVMPERKGFDVHLDIFKQKPHIKVLFVTGYSETEVELAQIRRKGLPLLMKPYSPNNLLNNVRELLNA